MDTSLSELQREHRAWIERNFPNQTLEDVVLGVCEEAGELAHHLLKMKQGIRGSVEEHAAGIGDSIADLIIFGASIADFLGVDYGELVQSTWAKVSERDWVKFPADGRTTYPDPRVS